MTFFSVCLRQARRDRGITQSELAKLVGASLLTIQNIEKGCPPKLPTIERLMDALCLERIEGSWICAYRGPAVAPAKPGRRKGKG